VAGGADNKKPTTVSSRGFLSKFFLKTTSTDGVVSYYDDCQINLSNILEHRPKDYESAANCQAIVREA
jgi:hypothetical protein